jgi:glycosyltransferase involved in cell wall biosynthesis
MRVLLVAPFGHGGEEVYARSLVDHAPEGVSYDMAGDFHQGTDGARCLRIREMALNRLVHPRTIPDIGFRCLEVGTRFDLVHVHAHPVYLRGSQPVVMSEGSSSAVYLQDYLGWSDEQLAAGFRRTRKTYRALAIRDRLLAMERASSVYVFSEWARDVNIRWGADGAKLTVVHPGFPTPARCATPGGNDTFEFLFVGTDFERKGGYEVVLAFHSIATAVPHARLRIVAEPHRPNPDRLAHRWVPESSRADAVRILDELVRRGLATVEPLRSRTELYETTYPRAGAFVMPTYAEGFGFTNVEAMSFGLPVVSSTAGPMPSLYGGSPGFTLVRPGAVDDLAEAMRRLAADTTASARAGRLNRADFERRFTIAQQQERLRVLYEASQ